MSPSDTPAFGTAALSGSDRVIRGTNRDDRLDGTPRADLILGRRGDDTLMGGAGGDLLFGQAGRDVLSGGPGGDLLSGGRGFDTAVFDGTLAEFEIRAGRFAWQPIRVTEIENGDTDLLRGIEALRFEDAVIFLDGRNNDPQAEDDAAATGEDEVLEISAADLLDNDADFDGDPLRIASVDAVSDAGAAIGFDGGVVTYDSARLFDGLAEGETATDTFGYSISDGRGGSDTASVTVTIIGAADGPALSVKPQVDFAEGDEGTVLVARAEGATFSLGGADAGLFAIDPATGVLSFAAAPDFETPGDADGDNAHELVLRATGPGGVTKTDVTVDVTNQDEVPIGVEIAAQSFEDEVPGAQYVDTGDAALDHDLNNNPGQSPVDSTLAGYGFDASYENTLGDSGLTDGDFVGVTGFTGDVGAFTNGTQGYQMQDADGLMRVRFDALDVSGVDGVTVSLDWFLNETGWEPADFARIYVETDQGEATIFDTSGSDIDDLGIEGAWMRGEVLLDDAVTSAELVVELQSNSASEALYIDNVRVASGGGQAAGTSYAIAALGAEREEGDAGATAFTLTVTRSGDVSGAGSVCYAVTSRQADGTDFGGAMPEGEVVFAAGQTEATLIVEVSGDADPEPDEAFEVHIFDPSGGGRVATSTAAGVIVNDDATPLAISAIQGAGAASDRVGELVTVTAIVTGDFQNGDADATRDLGGFFLQQEAADQDGDAATSEGIRVFEGDLLADVAVGDRVTVTGTVTEFAGETQIAAQSVTVDEAGAVADVTTLAANVTLDDIDAVVTDGGGNLAPDLEAFEGMLVRFTDSLVVSELFQLDRYNEMRLAVDAQPEQFTQFSEPDATGYDAYLEATLSDRIVYDDGLNVQNGPILEEADLDGDGDFDTADGFTMGDSVEGLTGIVTWDDAGPFSDPTWRVRSPLDGLNDFEDTDTREASPPDVGGSLKVASFNVLNFFTTLRDEGLGSGPNDLGPRGASDLAEYERQLDKLLTTLSALDSDVIGLVELENEFQSDQNGDGEFAIQAVVDGMNAIFGAGTWASVDPGRPFVDTGDAISVGMIYDTTTVELVPGSVEILDDSDLPALGGDYGTGAVFDGPDTNRAPLAATFADIATGEDFTVAVTHMKSKGGTGSGGNADAGDGAGNFDETRTEGVRALTDWLATFADEDTLVLGDFNAYAREDPIDAMRAACYTDLAEAAGSGASSFVFDSFRGALDYGFANVGVLDDVTGAEVWRISSPEADALDYNLDFGRDPAIFDGDAPYRASDHDPLLIGLQFGEDALIF